MAYSPMASFKTSTLADTEPPTTPGNLQTLYLTDELIHLRWEASKDEIGVTGYRIKRQGGRPLSR